MQKSERHIVPMSPMIEGFRDRWTKLMLVRSAGVCPIALMPVVAIHREAGQGRHLERPGIRREATSSVPHHFEADGAGQKWQRPYLQMGLRVFDHAGEDGPSHVLAGQCSALKHTNILQTQLEFSLGMFHSVLGDISGNLKANGKTGNTKAGSNSMSKNYEFVKLLRDVEQEMTSIRLGLKGRTKADRHPKMGKTLELLLAHFLQAEEEERTLGEKNTTRAMVFCTYRECVIDVVVRTQLAKSASTDDGRTC